MPPVWFQNTLNGGMVAVKEPRDRAQGLTFLPAVPHQGLLFFRVIDPRPILHWQHPPLYR